MNELIDEIKELIIKSLNLEDMKPSDIDENAPLFNEGLGLDSVDALGGVLIPGCEDDCMRAFPHAIRVQCSGDHLLLELLVSYDDEAELL